MTQAQADAHCCGVVPEEHDPVFVAQHLSAYEFAKRYAIGKNVLEVGFGSGYGAHFLADIAHEVVGVDVAPGNIPRAAARYSRPNLRFLQMDATVLQFPDESFDLICSFQVIEHIPEPLLQTYVSEISRVLKADGVFCVSTLNLPHNMKPGRPYQKLIYHEKEFTARELGVLLRQSFPLVDMHGLHVTWRHRLFQRLKRWGLDRWGRTGLNPIMRFYGHASCKDFTVSHDVSGAALDLIALCRKQSEQKIS